MQRPIGLFVVLLSVTASFSQEAMDEDTQKLEVLYAEFQRHLQTASHDSLAALMTDYAAAENFIPTYGLQFAMLMQRSELLDVAEDLVSASIERNSLEGLERMSPGMGNPIKLADAYKQFYSLRAWVRWRRGDPGRAWADMQTAIAYRDSNSQPSAYGVVRFAAEDLLRIGILAHARGDTDAGWTKIREGLLLEKGVEDSDPHYRQALEHIAMQKLGALASLDSIVADLHTAVVKPLPPMQLVSLEGAPVDCVSDRPRLVLFLSPACGTCQMELTSLSRTHAAGRDAVGDMLLILNQPKLQDAAIRLLEKHGMTDVQVAKLGSGNAYDLIEAEPTTWVVSSTGMIVERHTGYKEGDEERYLAELADARELDRNQ